MAKVTTISMYGNELKFVNSIVVFWQTDSYYLFDYYPKYIRLVIVIVDDDVGAVLEQDLIACLQKS